MTEHRNIHCALAAAQANMGRVVKGASNPAFRSKYADLADVVAVVVPALTAEGVALYHQMMRDEQGLLMRTTLAHGASETKLDCDVPLIVDKNNMQAMKSATTYAKRIGVESLTGIAPEDDDGNAAASAPPGPRVEKRTAPDPDGISAAIDAIGNAGSLDALLEIWRVLPAEIKSVGAVVMAKDMAKDALKQPANDDSLSSDEIPY